MYKGMTAEQFMEWANNHIRNDLDFTRHMVEYVKDANNELYREVIKHLEENPGKYKVKLIEHLGPYTG